MLSLNPQFVKQTKNKICYRF